jgi:ribonuclease HII
MTTKSRTTKRGARPNRPGRKLMRHDRALGVRLVAGADEAGRGCLAGPIVTAAVVLDCDSLQGPDVAVFGHLNDSKKVPEPMRSRLYDAVIERAVAWSVVVISPQTIDRRGLHVCNIRGLCLALDRLTVTADLALVDGFALPNRVRETRRMVKGDATSASIAAASIIAKVTRDRLMDRLDEQLEGRWAFADHVGYATPLHHERIRIHGLSDHHRRSFASVAYEHAGLGPSDISESVDDSLDAFDPAVSCASHEEHIEPVAAGSAV